MDLSIIIVSYNTLSYVRDCLTSVVNTMTHSDISYEVIVVDNASHDGTQEMVRKEFSDTNLVENTQNIGFGKANNIGIKIAKGETILLLNSDTVVLPNAIESLYKFTKRQKMALVGPKLFNMNRSVQSSCGPFFTLPVVFASLFLKGDMMGMTRWSPNKTKDVDWISGAAMMASKKMFLDDLLFDEQVFLYMEEVDLCYRAKKKGYKVLFYPAAHIIHIGSGSSTSGKKTPILNIYKGLLFFYKKHYKPFSYTMVRFFLKAKAILGIVFGTLVLSKRIKSTYAEAYRLV